MAIASIVAAVVAFLFMLLGLLLTVIPFAGTLMSFGAPVVALAGIVLGGVATSRLKRDGEPTGLAIAGIVLNVVAFLPATVVALTCGLCNACVTAGSLAPKRDAQFDFRGWDAGMGTGTGTGTGPGTGGGAGAGAGSGADDEETAVDVDAPPTEQELAAQVEMLNDVCPDTWCEGEFDYKFQELACEGESCTLRFEAQHFESEERYAPHELTIEGFDRVLECSAWSGSGASRRCTGRGMSSSFNESLNRAIRQWEKRNRP